MTLLLIETEKITDDDLMSSYNSSFKIKKVFKSLIKDNLFIDFQKLTDVCLADRTLRNVVKLFDIPTLKEIVHNIIPNSTEYSHNNMKNIILSVLLGELSLEEIIESELNFVHLVGITTKMEWADGRLYTPFEFFHHDLVHAYNIMGALGNIIDELNHLYQYIKLNKEKLGKAYYDIIVILFLLVHESAATYDVLKMTNPTIRDVGAMVSFIDNVDNWMNPYFFGGLLPEEIKGQKDKIISYLNASIDKFMKLWREIPSSTTEPSQVSLSLSSSH